MLKPLTSLWPLNSASKWQTINCNYRAHVILRCQSLCIEHPTLKQQQHSQPFYKWRRKRNEKKKKNEKNNRRKWTKTQRDFILNWTLSSTHLVLNVQSKCKTVTWMRVMGAKVISRNSMILNGKIVWIDWMCSAVFCFRNKHSEEQQNKQWTMKNEYKKQMKMFNNGSNDNNI